MPLQDINLGYRKNNMGREWLLLAISLKCHRREVGTGSQRKNNCRFRDATKIRAREIKRREVGEKTNLTRKRKTSVSHVRREKGIGREDGGGHR